MQYVALKTCHHHSELIVIHFDSCRGLGSITPNIKCFLEGRVAAYRIFQMIDRVPPIDIENPGGKRLESVRGDIDICNVDFAYPSRMEAPIFKNFNISIPAGKCHGLVVNAMPNIRALGLQTPCLNH